MPLFDLAAGAGAEAVSAATMGSVVAARMRQESGGWSRGIRMVPAGNLEVCGGRGGSSSAGEALEEGLLDALAASLASPVSIPDVIRWWKD